MRRTSRDVASQAVIFATLGFRASLEVTEHPRSEVLCSRLMPWLNELNLGGRIEEHHREILETPYRELTAESRTEAYWRGEAASFLGWAVQASEPPDLTSAVDPGVLVQNLRIIRPDTRDWITNARLRSDREIDDFCTFCLTVRHQFQLSSLDEDRQSVLNHIHGSRLAELGLSSEGARHEEIRIEAAQLVSAVPGARGLYVVRALTAEWLLGADL